MQKGFIKRLGEKNQFVLLFCYAKNPWECNKKEKKSEEEEEIWSRVFSKCNRQFEPEGKNFKAKS